MHLTPILYTFIKIFHFNENERCLMIKCVILTLNQLHDEILNDIGSHVNIKACIKMTINEMLTLINVMENHFHVSLVSKNMLSPWWYENSGSMSSSLSTLKIQSMCALKMSVQCVSFFRPKKKKPSFALIYIYHTLHTLIGPFD